ncbi:PAS domain S-box-containing protein [Lacibacter cauensis]|uniref:histidine kinase n=1 Tax=Lacibacter cauensis TaxID=510947 RepID=A0A562SVN1_9BACT|nr:ATP-binding protein [Lacibacter cauensis]TWI85325.1 PAS domain S-box-containing protein [Lacibacter cauensis]
MTNPINKRMIFALSLLTIAVSAVALISIWQSQQIKKFDAEITRFEENRYLTQQLTMAVLDNETGARGFVITAQKAFLEPMISSERKLDELRILLAKRTLNPELATLINDSLSPLIDLRKEFSWQMAALVNSKKYEEAVKLVLEGRGKYYTDEVRRIANKIDTIRNKMLDLKRLENERFIQNSNAVQIVVLILVLIISAFNFRQLVRIFNKQKETELQLRTSEQLYSALFYKSPIAKWIVDPATSKMLDVNNSFCELFQIKPESVIGKSTADIGLANTPGIREAVQQQLAATGCVRNLEYKTTLQNGDIKWVSMSIDPIKLDGKDCFVGASADITSLKEKEQLIAEMNENLEEKVSEKTAELRKNEKKLQELNDSLERMVEHRTAQLSAANKELEAFSYSVSHDLRAPLRGIIGFANIIQEDYGANMQEEEKRLFGIIQKNTQKMGNLIDDLLDFSRLGRKEISKTTIDTQALVKEVIDEMGKSNARTDAVEWIIGTLPSVNADLSTLRQVWVNLISNALKYSKQVSKPVIKIGSYREDDQLVFFVKDNGVGFDEQYKNKLFQVFQRLHSESEFEGTGIGLALVQKIITRHEGKVWATGEVNKGAEFYFSLPQ